MKERSQTDEVIIFRAPKTKAKSVDKLAKLMGVNRSEAMRRLIPNLSRASSKEGA